MTDDCYIDFLCNCYGSRQHTPAATVARKDASRFECGLSVQMRSIMHQVGIALFERPLILPDFPGQRACAGWAALLPNGPGVSRRSRDVLEARQSGLAEVLGMLERAGFSRAVKVRQRPQP